MLTQLLGFALTALLSPQDSRARAAQASFELTPAIRTEVVERLCATLKSSYVFPDVAEELELSLRAHLRDKDYDALTDPRAFAERLTEHLRELNDDRHLGVKFSAERLSQRDDEGEPGPAQIERRLAEDSNVNFGFECVKRLPGNVGYLDLRGFFPVQHAAPTAHAAMAFLSNADALIVDLRENGGGEPGMVRLLCSYLFGPQPVHLNDLYFRPDDRTEEFWTLEELPGKRLIDQPVFVLTSGYTFSGAEEFAYNLQCQKRATTVGETTGGGAHPGGSHRLHDHFRAFIPSGRAINPITKTNWEGVGVKPDVECSAPVALARAHVLAVEKLLSAAKSADDRERLEMALTTARRELDRAVESR